MKALVIGPCSRLNFHAAQTAAFNKQIFQQSLLPSVASANGCITEMYAKPIQGLSSPGMSLIVPLI